MLKILLSIVLAVSVVLSQEYIKEYVCVSQTAFIDFGGKRVKNLKRLYVSRAKEIVDDNGSVNIHVGLAKFDKPGVKKIGKETIYLNSMSPIEFVRAVKMTKNDTFYVRFSCIEVTEEKD